MVDVSKLVITQVDQITTFNNANELEFILDELQDTTISHTEEKVDVLGKGGRKIAAMKKNKAVVIKGTNGAVCGGTLAAQTGSNVEQGSFRVRITDILTATDNAAVTEKQAVGTVGAEIGTLYRKNADGSLGEKLVQVAATPQTGEFTYAPDTKAITLFAGDIAEGMELVAFYDVEVEAAKITNESDTYSKILKMYIDVTAQDSCDKLYHGQFIIPRANFSGAFDLTIGKEPCVHAFEAESLVGGCTRATKLWDFIVY